jgi:hypothetical protein
MGTVASQYDNDARPRDQVFAVTHVLLLLIPLRPREWPDNQTLCVGTSWYGVERSERTDYALLAKAEAEPGNEVEPFSDQSRTDFTS